MARFPQIHKSHHNNKVYFLFFKIKSLAEEVAVVDFAAKTKAEDGFGSDRNRRRSTFPQYRMRAGLYTFRKSE
ncbi:MAG TPA: hypothetical protein VJN92_22040 [Candidatus Acidoferrum sp.]|nr:hypothetical protein [Candidatus Acidoferrum sp.]